VPGVRPGRGIEGGGRGEFVGTLTSAKDEERRPVYTGQPPAVASSAGRSVGQRSGGAGAGCTGRRRHAGGLARARAGRLGLPFMGARAGMPGQGRRQPWPMGLVGRRPGRNGLGRATGSA
jgi:hypothetical protein